MTCTEDEYFIASEIKIHFFRKTKIRKDIIKQDLSLGFPSLIAQISWGIVMITFNAIILKFSRWLVIFMVQGIIGRQGQCLGMPW